MFSPGKKKRKDGRDKKRKIEIKCTENDDDDVRDGENESEPR